MVLILGTLKPHLSSGHISGAKEGQFSKESTIIICCKISCVTTFGFGVHLYAKCHNTIDEVHSL